MSRLPTFVVIGAARSGTTALYTFLRQHPAIFMSGIKEPNYFAFEPGRVSFSGPGAEFVNDSVREYDDYQKLFSGATDEHKAVGEASPLYLYSPHSPARIAAQLPDVRLIAILRNPIEQAYSHYLYARAQMIEPLDDFRAALTAQKERLEANWQPLFQYSTFPRYGEQLARYFSLFDRSRICVFPYEQFDTDPQAVLREIYRFIGVDDTFAAVTTHRTNQGGVPRNAMLQSLVMRPNPISVLAGRLLPDKLRRVIKDKISSGNTQREEMPNEARALLVDELRDDVMALSALLQMDLSHWLRLR